MVLYIYCYGIIVGLGRAYTGHCTHRTIIMRAFCHVWVTSESERVGNLAWQLRCMCWLVRQMYEGVRAKDMQRWIVEPQPCMHYSPAPASAWHARARWNSSIYAVCKQVCGGRWGGLLRSDGNQHRGINSFPFICFLTAWFPIDRSVPQYNTLTTDYSMRRR